MRAVFAEKERERTTLREKDREKERDGGKSRDKEARERERERTDERLPALRFTDDIYEYIAQRAIEELFALEAPSSAATAGVAAGGDNLAPPGTGVRPITPAGKAAAPKSAGGSTLKSANPRDQKKVDDSYGERPLRYLNSLRSVY